MHDGTPYRRALERLRSQLRLKATLTVALVLGVCLPFFLIEYFPLLAPKQLTPTALDRWLGFDHRWVWVYSSLYLYMPIVPLLLVRRSHLMRYAAGMAGMTGVACAMFLLYPTAVSRPPVEGTQVAYRWLVGLDRPSNAVPSLHCAFAVFTALSADFALRSWRPARAWKLAMWSWCALICFSALATKQHLVVDAITGSALGLAGYSLAWRHAGSRAPSLSSVPEPS